MLQENPLKLCLATHYMANRTVLRKLYIRKAESNVIILTTKANKYLKSVIMITINQKHTHLESMENMVIHIRAIKTENLFMENQEN